MGDNMKEGVVLLLHLWLQKQTYKVVWSISNILMQAASLYVCSVQWRRVHQNVANVPNYLVGLFLKPYGLSKSHTGVLKTVYRSWKWLFEALWASNFEGPKHSPQWIVHGVLKTVYQSWKWLFEAFWTSNYCVSTRQLISMSKRILYNIYSNSFDAYNLQTHQLIFRQASS